VADSVWACLSVGLSSLNGKEKRIVSSHHVTILVLANGQADFAETRKRKHRKYCECSQVPSYTVDLISINAALAHFFFESVFCSCSVWYAATSVPRSRSLIRWLVRFAHSFTRCLATKPLNFLQIFFGLGWRPAANLEATEVSCEDCYRTH